MSECRLDHRPVMRHTYVVQKYADYQGTARGIYAGSRDAKVTIRHMIALHSDAETMETAATWMFARHTPSTQEMELWAPS